MKKFQLNIQNRTELGRGAAHRTREAGRIPACVYAKGTARSISVSAKDFRLLQAEAHGGASFIELNDEEGGKTLTLVQDLQVNPLKDRVDHIDFHEIERGHFFTTQVPVVLVGESACEGVKKDGGVIDFSTQAVEIRTRPSKLPEHIEIDVSALRLGDSIHIRDLPQFEEVTYLGDADIPVVTVTGTSSAASLAAETGEPELIGAADAEAKRESGDD